MRTLLEVRTLLFDTLLRQQTVTLEYVLAGQCLLWGAWVAWPWTDAFHEIPHGYALVRELPEWAVGLIFFVHGCHYVWHLSHRANGGIQACRRGALVTSALWAVILGTWLISIPAAPIAALHVSNSIAAFWVYLRLRLRYPPHQLGGA